jgi:predicted nucleic acid-binding protein
MRRCVSSSSDGSDWNWPNSRARSNTRQFSDLTVKLLAAFTIVSAGVSEHVEAARIKNVCLRKGLNVSGVDCLIAACTITGSHELFALDEDFEAIAMHAPLTLFRAHPVA